MVYPATPPLLGLHMRAGEPLMMMPMLDRAGPGRDRSQQESPHHRQKIWSKFWSRDDAVSTEDWHCTEHVTNIRGVFTCAMPHQVVETPQRRLSSLCTSKPCKLDIFPHTRRTTDPVVFDLHSKCTFNCIHIHITAATATGSRVVSTVEARALGYRSSSRGVVVALLSIKIC